ncbi:MICOS complex subunit MIC27 isoform X1 [Frankliniella occidentalis]|uniref:MICOS complex subunit n=1 Tax=Frankliniella occidentalis TaxID=133901 RepID=A0A9C6X5F1_FRAOC|nr:MICOS complex subunit MIC27 isoform X1 [Frankliniella occidentalis]
MANWKLLRSMLIPRNMALAAVPIAVKSKETEKDKTAIRPSELPIYVDEIKRQVVPEQHSDEVSSIEEAVGTVRKELCSLVSEVNSLTSKASSVVKENMDASNELLDYLKEEENFLPRSGAIALSGLTGLVLGIRKGFFKRLIYMTVGAGGMASLCYPKEAEEYFNEALVEVRKYGLIGHHLATSSYTFFDDESTDQENWGYEDEYTDEFDYPSLPPPIAEGAAESVIEHKYALASEQNNRCVESIPSLEHSHTHT